MPCRHCGNCAEFVPQRKSPGTCANCHCSRDLHTLVDIDSEDGGSRLGASPGSLSSAGAGSTSSGATGSDRALLSPASGVPFMPTITSASHPVWWPVKHTRSAYVMVQLQTELLNVDMRSMPRSLFRDRSKLRRAAVSLTSFGSKPVDISTLRGKFHVRFRACGPLVKDSKRPPRKLTPPEDLDDDPYEGVGSGRTEPTGLLGLPEESAKSVEDAAREQPPFVSWACVPTIRLPLNRSLLSVTTVTAELWFECEPRYEPVMLAEVIIKGRHLFEPGPPPKRGGSSSHLDGPGGVSSPRSSAAGGVSSPRRRGSDGGDAHTDEAYLGQVMYVSKRLAVAGGGSAVLSVRATPAAWRRRSYACELVEGTTLRQSYQFPSQHPDRHLLVHEECTEVDFSSLVPCQFYRRRCESLKLQREILLSRLQDCALRLHGANAARKHARKPGAGRKESKPPPISRENTFDRQQANLFEMLSSVYGMSPGEFEDTPQLESAEEERLSWLHDHLDRYDRAIEQYTHLANYFSTLYLKARRFSARSRRFGRDTMSQTHDLAHGVNRSKAFFKPSARKKDPLLCAVPINLHLQTMTVQEVGGAAKAQRVPGTGSVTPSRGRRRGGVEVATPADAAELPTERERGLSVAAQRRRRASHRMSMMRRVITARGVQDMLDEVSDTEDGDEDEFAGFEGFFADPGEVGLLVGKDGVTGAGLQFPADEAANGGDGGAGGSAGGGGGAAEGVSSGGAAVDGADGVSDADGGGVADAGGASGAGASEAGSRAVDRGHAGRASIQIDAEAWLQLLQSPVAATAAAPPVPPPTSTGDTPALAPALPPTAAVTSPTNDTGLAASWLTLLKEVPEDASSDAASVATSPGHGSLRAGSSAAAGAGLGAGAGASLGSSVGSRDMLVVTDAPGDAGLAPGTPPPHKNAVLEDVRSSDRCRTPSAEYATVTFGAPAHHAFGFHKGGLYRLRQRVPGLKAGVSASSFVEEWVACSGDLGVRDGDTPGTVGHNEHELPLHAVETAFGVQLREDAVMSQALSALVTAFTHRIDADLVADRMELLRLLPRSGFLLQLESLLSTAGNEIGMLEDLVIAFHLLAKVVIVLRDEDDELAVWGDGTGDSAAVKPSATHDTPTGVSDTDSGDDEDDPRYHMLSTLRHLSRLRVYSGPQYEAARGEVKYLDTPLPTSTSRPPVRSASAPVSKSRAAVVAAALAGSSPGSARGGERAPTRAPRRATPCFVVELTLPHGLFASLPTELQQHSVAVVPVMFTQGINEMQTIANAISESGLQHSINEHSLRMLQGFARKWGSTLVGANRHMLQRNLNALQEAVRLEGVAAGKHYAVLTLAADIVRELHGARLTCCKSGKDRTAMSVTLEQARQLHHHHSLAKDHVLSAANAMRGHGVRLEVCRKNIGKPRYAFNALQVKLLPSVYRPPAHTTSSNVST